MDDGGSDVLTWDEINAREIGTDGFFEDADDWDGVNELDEQEAEDYFRYDEDLGEY